MTDPVSLARGTSTRVRRPRIGPGWFGPAYARMMARDPHALGTIDRQILGRLVGLDSATAEELYGAPRMSEGAPRGIPSPLVRALSERAAPRARPARNRIQGVVRLVHAMDWGGDEHPAQLRFGGTEEEIILRGSAWCTDLARVTVALLRSAGVPSRFVALADPGRPYHGHMVVEAWDGRSWGALDVVEGRVHSDPEGRPASAWDLMQHPAWLGGRVRGPYDRAGQYGVAAIGDYPPPPYGPRAFAISRVSPYYRSILGMSDRGWPGGLRWLHGEDDAATRPRRSRSPARNDGDGPGLVADERVGRPGPRRRG